MAHIPQGGTGAGTVALPRFQEPVSVLKLPDDVEAVDVPGAIMPVHLITEDSAEVTAMIAELDKLDKEDFLKLLSDAQVTCRAYTHPWPIPVPGRKLPKGYNHVPQHDGSYKVTHTCPRCGEFRTKITLPGGLEDPLATWAYFYPEGWVRLPIEAHISKLDIKNEYSRRFYGRLTDKTTRR